MSTTVFVRRTSGELEAGWHTVGAPRTYGEDVVQRVRCFITHDTFVEKDVLVEALAMWQAEAAAGAPYRSVEAEGPLLPTTDRLDMWDGFARLLGGS